MKAIILAIQGKSAAALSDGCIIKIPDHQYAVGQKIMMKAPKAISKKAVTFAIGAAAALILTVLSGVVYFTPYSYVSLDVNPSIAYSVNRFDRVLSANGVNQDGKAVLEQISLKNKDIETAVKETVEEVIKEGYIPEDEAGGIVIAASCDNETKSDTMADKLKIQAETVVAEKGCSANVEAEGVGKERVREAQALGVTPGKLNLVQKLQASAGETTVNIEEWLDKPVKEIMKAIKENKNEPNKGREESQIENETSVSSNPSSTNPDSNEKNTASGESSESGKTKAAQEQKRTSTEKENNQTSSTSHQNQSNENANSTKQTKQNKQNTSDEETEKTNNGNGRGREK